MKHIINMPIEIDDKDIFDIFSNAESDYWVDHYRKPFDPEEYADNYFEKHGSIDIVCDYNMNGKTYKEKYHHGELFTYKLTIEKMLKGIELYVKHGLSDMKHWFSDFGEWNETDSIGADIIVQLALFGEVIYG